MAYISMDDMTQGHDPEVKERNTLGSRLIPHYRASVLLG